MVISIWYIQRAVADKATVPIYYDLLREPHLTPSRPRSVGLRPTRCVVHLLRCARPSGSLRLAIFGFASGSVAPLGSFGSKLSLNAAELPKLDAEFEEITEGERGGKFQVGMQKEEVRTRFRPSLFCLRTSHCGGQGDPTFDTAQAIAVMLEKHGIAGDLIHGCNSDKWATGKPTERLALLHWHFPPAITTEGQVIDGFTAAGLIPSASGSFGLCPPRSGVCLISMENRDGN